MPLLTSLNSSQHFITCLALNLCFDIHDNEAIAENERCT